MQKHHERGRRRQHWSRGCSRKINVLRQGRREGNAAGLEHAQRQRHHRRVRPHRLRLGRKITDCSE